VTPATINASMAHEIRPPAAPATTSPNAPAADASAAGTLHADQAIPPSGAASLTPCYYQPKYLVLPSGLLLAFSAAWFWQRRRETAPAATASTSSLDPRPLIQVMNDARAAGDSDLFFKSARAALQRYFAAKWQLVPEAVTIDEVNAHLGPTSDVARLFALADESAYAGVHVNPLDYQEWSTFVSGQIYGKVAS
jgi:hypothetical protein